MDMFTLAMGVAATVVIGVVMLAITKFGFGGESEYEQQIAHQKEVLLVDDKGKSMEKKKAKNEKKKSKVVKPKSDIVGQAMGSQLVAEGKGVVNDVEEDMPPHIEYDPDPIIIEPDTPPPVVTKKSKKSGPNKSILHNKDEVPLTKSADAPVTETVFATSPKDDVELKLFKPKKAGQKKEKPKSAVATTDEPKPVAEEVIAAVASTQSSALPITPQPIVEDMIVAKVDAPVQRPAQPAKKPKSKSKTGRELEDLMTLIGEATLSKDQMQALINSLLARIESDDSWTTKGVKPDPVTVLRKQLEELQSAHAEEISNVASAQAKIKDVTNKWTAAEKQSAASASQLQELQKRMQHTHDQHQKDIQVLTAAGYQDKQKVEQQNEMISQLSEENQRLKQSVANTEEVTNMQKQLSALASEKQSMLKQLSDSNRAVEDAKHEMERSKESRNSAEVANAELKKRCDELGERVAQAENAVVQEQSKVTQAEQNAKNLQDHMHTQLKDKEQELQTLMDELNKTRELHQHAPINGNHEGSTNGVAGEYEQKISSLEQTVTDKDSQLSNLNKQLSVARGYQSDLATFKQKSLDEAKRCSDLERQVTDLQTQVQTLKDKNNDMKRQIWALTDSLEKAESLSLLKSATESDIEDKTCIINELKDSNSKLLSQNNELQERCGSMDSLQSQVSSLIKQVQESKQALDSKDSLVAQLEKSLKEEEQKVSNSSSEQEIEKLSSQLSLVLKDKQELQEKCGSMDSLQSQVSSLMKQVQESKQALDSKDSLVAQLEKSLKEEEQKVSSSASEQEVERLGSQLTLVLKEKQVLEERVQKLEATKASKPVNDSIDGRSKELPTDNLLVYKNALRQVDTMLDSLTVNVQREHGKISVMLRSKDEQLKSLQAKLDEAAKKLNKSVTERGDADEKFSKLMKELTESKQKLVELQKSRPQSGVDNNTEAAAMANNGSGDDSGTCV